MKKIIHLLLTVCLVGMMCFSSFAAETYIYDEAGILTAEELHALDAKAASVSNTYGCGVYTIILNNYREYSTSDVFTTATELYHGLELGKGSGRDGILLMLSMRDRDYATFFYGNDVEYAFDEYGQILLEEQFLDDFADDDWYDGLHDYITVSGEFLGRAASGDPVRESYGFAFAIAIGVSVVLAFVVTMIMRASMNSVHKGGSAAAYAADGGLRLTTRGDYFLYNTQTRRRIERSSSSSGSGSHRGGGGSGRSGKF